MMQCGEMTTIEKDCGGARIRTCCIINVKIIDAKILESSKGKRR